MVNITRNKQLSIVIPVYNRADFLDHSLKIHVPMAREYGIEISIFDNASTDHTKEVISKWMEKYALLSYHRNETNVGADANFNKALTQTVADYVWLLGDTYQIPENGIRYILERSKYVHYDAFVFNLENKIKIESKVYQDGNALLNELGALMTCCAVSVYSKELIARAKFSRFYKTHFLQTGIIFEDIASRDFMIDWVESQSVEMLENLNLRKTNWSHTSNAFEIGCRSWINFIMSLPPSYELENKLKCVMDFGKISGLFTFKNLIHLRMKDVLNKNVFYEYKKLFPLTIEYSLTVIFVIASTPIFLLKVLFAVSKFVLKK